MAAQSDQPGQSPRRAAEVLFESLALSILKGEYAAGSELPSERTLAARFKVSRGTVREAVHMLKSAQLVRVSQGASTVVLPADASLDVRVIGLRYRLDDETVHREIEERRVLQGLTLVYLAERRGSRETFEEVLAKIDRFVERGCPEAEADELEALVWTKIAEATNNRFLLREVRWWFHQRTAMPAGASSMPPAARASFYRELARRLRDRDHAAQFFFDLLPVLAQV